MSIVIIGKNSFLARAVRDFLDTKNLRDTRDTQDRRDTQDTNQPSPKNWIFLSHTRALEEQTWPENAQVVINCALHPAMRQGDCTPQTDIDSRLAQKILPYQAHYIMLSSRMVYGLAGEKERLEETHPLAPHTPYGRAKKQAEENVRRHLGERLTILRLSNIFGFELEDGRRSFLSMALQKLREEGLISYDMNPLVRRDFLSSTRCAEALVTIANAPQAGVFNLGSGIGLETGHIAEWLIEGYGAGALDVTDNRLYDGFHLDMKKTRAAYNVPILTKQDLRADCIAIGRRLKTLSVQLDAVDRADRADNRLRRLRKIPA